MTPLDHLLRTRRTVHHFQPAKTPQAWLDEAFASAIRAPNHKRTNPWTFYALSDQTAAKVIELNTRLLTATKGPAAAEHKRKRWSEIPGWMVLTCRRTENEFRQQEDFAACCCAAQNWMLSLWSRGIGTKWSTGPVTRDPEFYELIGADTAKEFTVGLFWYGHPADETLPARSPKTDVIRSI